MCVVFCYYRGGGILNALCVCEDVNVFECEAVWSRGCSRHLVNGFVGWVCLKGVVFMR